MSMQNTLPSLTEFFAICEYFGITVTEFFDEKQSNPKQVQDITEKLRGLNDADLALVSSLLDRLRNK